MPEHLGDELKVRADVSDRHVDIVEVRPPWDGLVEHAWFPIARLRHTQSTGQRAIYWRDRNLKFHEHKHKPPTKNVRALLAVSVDERAHHGRRGSSSRAKKGLICR